MKKAIIIIASIITLIVYNKEIESWYKSFTGAPIEVLGTYYGPEGSIEIRGESTCVVRIGLMPSPRSASYERDGDLIRVERAVWETTGLLFTIKDEETLIEMGGDVYRKK